MEVAKWREESSNIRKGIQGGKFCTGVHYGIGSSLTASTVQMDYSISGQSLPEVEKEKNMMTEQMKVFGGSEEEKKAGKGERLQALSRKRNKRLWRKTRCPPASPCRSLTYQCIYPEELQKFNKARLPFSECIFLFGRAYSIIKNCFLHTSCSIINGYLLQMYYVSYSLDHLMQWLVFAWLCIFVRT